MDFNANKQKLDIITRNGGNKMSIRRELEEMPFAKAFYTENGNEELCNSIGYEEYDSSNDCWWNEYRDSQGNLYYGR